MIRLDHQPDGLALASKTIPYNPATCRVISRTTRSGMLLGGVIYDGFNGASCRMHVASFHKSWLSRDMLWVCFHYPFVQCNLLKVLAFIPSRNQKVLDFNAKLGFIQEFRIKDASVGGDLVITSMRREDCRWLNIKPRTLGSNV